jgi:hypothetical protein
MSPSCSRWGRPAAGRRWERRHLLDACVAQRSPRRAPGQDPGGRGRGAGHQACHRGGRKYFVGNAQTLRELEAVETSLRQNAKIIVPSDSELVNAINVIGELGGLLPVKMAKETPGGTSVAATRREK